MPRAILIVLDSVGIGGAADASQFGDEGADTVGHIAERCWSGVVRNGRLGPLQVPNLASLGLGAACHVATGRVPPGLETDGPLRGSYAAASEISRGKDTITGHWEIAGLPLEQDWGYFPHTTPAFPASLIDALVAQAGLPGVLGDCHASGTAIIETFGAEHIRTGKPICYTSADSVFQIAAHEQHFGLERLYDVCRIARELTRPLRIARVIARPFVGSTGQSFTRTLGRRDYADPPPQPTMLDVAMAANRDIVTVGKIADIFAHSGTGRVVKGHSNGELIERIVAELPSLRDGGLMFANLVDFDTEYGHRRDIAGYAAALEDFDAALPDIIAGLRPGDLLIVTADHGCDPTWQGTDHTREQVPVLAYGPGMIPRSLGQLSSFADIGASVCHHLGLPALRAGRSFL